MTYRSVVPEKGLQPVNSLIITTALLQMSDFSVSIPLKTSGAMYLKVPGMG